MFVCELVRFEFNVIGIFFTLMHFQLFNKSLLIFDRSKLYVRFLLMNEVFLHVHCMHYI
jgi:hypothetical protein